MNKDELKKVLELHSLWLVDSRTGEHANLRDANLRGADLRDADLRDADLRGVDLRGADLRGANLSYANLRDADLRDADLRGANLSYANLNDANLRDANLRGANLSGAATDDRYIQVSCIGSEKRMTTYNMTRDIIWCGCFNGTLKEFEMQVKKTPKDNPQYLKEYIGFIKYVKSLNKGE